MLEIAIYLVVLIILIFALVKLIDKFVTPGNKKVFIDPSIAVAALINFPDRTSKSEITDPSPRLENWYTFPSKKSD